MIVLWRSMALSIFALFTLITSCQSPSEPTLNILVWSDYFKPQLIKQFEKEHQCRLIIDTYDSNESMYAKLKLGSSKYDLIFPSNYFLELMHKQGMVHAFDLKQIQNLEHIDTRYIKKIPASLLTVGIPYMISCAGIAYRTDKIPAPRASWEIFEKANYKGRMTMLNDMRETIGAALLFLGYSVNTLDPQQINKAVDLLIQWKQNLAKFESEQYKSGLSSAEYLVINGYNGDVLQVEKENSHVAFFYPEEGVTFSIDFIALSQDAQNIPLAYKFIDYLLTPAISAENMEFTLFLSPNKGAYPLLPSELRNNATMFIPEEILNKAELIHYLGEEGILYHKAWDKIKRD